MTTDRHRLAAIFFPYAFERQQAAKAQGIRFVHYTTAVSATNILRSKSIWMRKTSCMIDFMEVQHGLDNLSEAYHGQAGDSFKAAVNRIFENISGEIANLFDGWQPYFLYDTYIACFSEHIEEEDHFGRLSMWRACDGPSVALVYNNRVFLAESDVLKVFFSPVAYLDDKGFQTELLRVANSIDANADFIREQGRKTLITYVFNVFKFAALCTKHLGFREEKEWRLVYTPKMETSVHMIKEVEVIRGIPQPICKIPLKNVPEEGLSEITIPELLHLIIIGPTEYPSVMREAFESLLADAGVDDPPSRIRVSDIPIRI